MHLVIPFAACDDEASRAARRALPLPHLHQLLQRLQAGPRLTLAADSPLLPHEQLQIDALGLNPQQPAWAAWRAGQLGLSTTPADHWALVTPCHWDVGQSRVNLLAPQTLGLSEAESRALLDSMAPYFAEDGISLHFDTPLRWLAHGAVFRDLVSATPERVAGHDIAPWLPTVAVLRRLQSEMQMLLYTHPVNEARQQRRAQVVNSLWFSGAGALTETNTTAPSSVPTASTNLQLVNALVAPALRASAANDANWTAWAEAWQQLDAEHLPALLRHIDAGHPGQLTLCSLRQAQTFTSAAAGWRHRLRRLWLRPSTPALLDTL